jgi:putative IMPACT (imprinted ancient) family translation regulator
MAGIILTVTNLIACICVNVDSFGGVDAGEKSSFRSANIVNDRNVSIKITAR